MCSCRQKRIDAFGLGRVAVSSLTIIQEPLGWPFLLEGSSPVLEEFLLPVVEDGRVESPFIAQLRRGFLLQQVPPQEMRPALPAGTTQRTLQNSRAAYYP